MTDASLYLALACLGVSVIATGRCILVMARSDSTWQLIGWLSAAGACLWSVWVISVFVLQAAPK